MNSGFSDFQDLLNITTNGEDLQALQDEVKALEEEVADNKLDISANTLAINVNSGLIATNTTNISNNGVLISNNTSSINNNTSSINNNTSSISFNTTTIANLNQEVLKKDGSVQLDPTFTPSNLYDLVSKDYVDSHSTSTAYLRVDGTNSMTSNLDVDGNSIYLDTSSNYIRSVNNEIFLVAPSDVALDVGGSVAFNAGVLKNFNFRTLDMATNDIINVTSINSTNFNTLVSDVATNTSDIIINTNNITTNTGNITTNTNNITTNTNNITTNTNNIATNTSNISTNASDILTKLSRTGDFMTGTNALGFGSLSKAISGQTGYLSIASNDDIHLITSLNPTVRITQASIQNYLPTTINSDLTFTGNINSISPTVFNYISSLTSDAQTQITTNTNNISTNTTDISTNTGNIATNTNNISTNTGNIATNASDITTNLNNINSNYGLIITNQNDISTNTSNISTNTSNIATKVSKSGDSMTGDLNLTSNSLVFSNIGSSTPEIFSDSGQIRIVHPGGFTYGPNTTQKNYEFPLTISTSNPCSLGNHVFVSYSLTSNDDLKTNANLIVAGTATIGDDTTIEGALTVEGTYGNMNRGSSHGGVRQIKILNTINPNAFWTMGNQYNSPSTIDNDFYFEVTYTNGSAHQAGFIQDSATNVQMNFTGQHRSMPDFKFTEDKVGLIVEATGRYMNLIKEGEECSQISCITINDSIPIVALCNEEKSKRVFGVISNVEEKDRMWQAGNFVSLYDKVEGDNRLYINSIGEGGIFVCNKNGNLQNGDYICASGINGYGMRQDLPYIANYTVAKITMDCDFNPQLEEVKIWRDGGWVMTGEYKPQYEMIELDDGLKIAFVGCTYHCG